jgi:uncharacterized protein (TIGR03083 family)
MPSLADRTIAALRGVHDDLAALVPTLTDHQLTGPSGAAEWSIAQVLSHLGSGAEISQATYAAAIDGTPVPEQDFSQGVWDRWNAMTPQEQATGFLKHDAALIASLEGLTSQQRESVQVKLGFLPQPLPLASATGMRLNEAAQHAWDVRVALDPAATVDAAAAEVIVEHFTGGLGFLLGFTGKTDQLAEPAVVNVDGSRTAIDIGESLSLTAPSNEPTATLSADPEALVRLLGVRLTFLYTPPGVSVTGNLTLDDLRRVFPGY